MVAPGRPFFESLIGKRIAGRYLVDRTLGSGGMGLIVAAKYPELGQRVAIKFLRPEYAEDSVVTARFLREARVAAKVKSPHFVRVFDVGKLETGVPYLVMELLTGQDLADELRERGPLSVHDAVDYVLQAGVALAELHAIGIVHRDLKPSNLFLEKSAGSPILKVLDFGVSKEQNKTESAAPLTNTDHVLGTPQYMSPEQIRASKDVDARSDVWSLGVILFELLSQALPFSAEGGGVGEMFGKILYVEPEKLSAKREGLPDGLEAVIDKCLARDRDKRFASVLELAEALRPFASESSIHRIEMLKKAANTLPPEPDDDPVVELAERSELASTQQSSPQAKREIEMAPTAAASERNLKVGSSTPAEAEPNAPVTAMTSSSGISRAKPIPPPPKPRLWIAFVAAIVLIGGGVATVMAVKGGAPATTPSATPITSADPPAASTSSVSTAIVLPSAEPTASATSSLAPAATTTPSATVTATSAPVKPRASGAVVAKPPVKPPPSATTAPTLILDRK